MATRTTEASNTLETFRVNFNGLVDDIGNVTVTSAGDQLQTTATTVVGAINEIFVGFELATNLSAANHSGSGNENTHTSPARLQPSSAETFHLIGSASVYSGSVTTTNIVTDITPDDTISFSLNNNLTSLVSVQTDKIHPTTGSSTFVQFSDADASNTYSVKFVSPGDTNLDFGSTQGFAAAMAVALG